MNDIITCCDKCRPYVPLIYIQPIGGYCPKCGRTWDTIIAAAKAAPDVEPETHNDF